MKLEELVLEIEAELYKNYQYLHEHPELGLCEFETSTFIKNIVCRDGACDKFVNVGQTGLVAVLHGEKEGQQRCLLLRGDMDALPIEEEQTNFPCSKNKGRMHACGHDAHTAILLGALQILKKCKKYFSGTIYFFFQPAEEILAGAKTLFSNSAIELDKIDGVAACHMIPDLYAGDIGLKSGVMLASADHFDVKVIGMGGHGAHPYTTVDPVTIAADIIVQLQNLVSREVSALDSAVVSICGIHSDGNTYNVIPDTVQMKGTLRALKKETRAKLKERIVEICTSIAHAGRAKCEVYFSEGPPPLHNNKELVERTKIVMGKILGEKHVQMLDIVTMGSEDFAYIMDKYPGVFVRIGCRSNGKEFTPIHSSKFIVDRKALTTGVLTLSGIALDFFGSSQDIEF